MHIFIFLSTYLILLFMNFSMAQENVLNKNEIALNHSVDRYDCTFYGERLNLVIYSRENRIIYHYILFDDKVTKLKEIKDKILIGTGTPNLKFIDNSNIFVKEHGFFKTINLNNNNERVIYEYKTLGKDNDVEYIYPLDYYYNDKRKYFVYKDNNAYRKFVVGITKIRRAYSKDFLLENEEDEISKPCMVQKGRKESRGFSAILLNDTLYSVWQERSKKSFGWIDLIPTPYSNEIVFSKFDGDKWQEPMIIVSSDEPKTSIESLVGIYLLDDKFYVFWKHNLDKESNYEHGIYYKWSSDQKNWSNLSKIDKKMGFIVSQFSTKENIHFLTKERENSDKTSYYIFDGINCKNMGIVIEEHSYSEKIILDRNNNAYIFWITGKPDKFKLYFRKINLN